MLKKIVATLISLALFLTNISFADDEDMSLEELNNIQDIVQIAASTTNVPNINSKYAVIIDRNTNSILYGKKELEKTKMASTTKIMTSIIVLENSNLNNIVEVSSKSASIGGSCLKLKKKDKISVKDLLYGLMLKSGNDAAIALAEHVAGSSEEFINMMNKKALELNLLNTHFESPHGLDSENHYTTAYELAILTNYALNNNLFRQIVSTKNYSITINGISKSISNTNELIGNLYGVYGVKTGFTNGAGRCLVTSVKREDLDIICVVLGADTKKDRTTDSVKLIEYTFKNFRNINIKEKIDAEFKSWLNINSKRISVKKAIFSSINLKLDSYYLEKYPIEIGSEDQIKIDVLCNFNLNAPVKENFQIGTIIVTYYDNIILEIPILTCEEIPKKKVIDYVLEFIISLSN